MTQNKNFKTRVRARMKKTGESYTAARGQLLKDAPQAQLANFARGARDWRQRGGIHAPTAALANLLAHAGVRAPHTDKPYTEEFLLGLGGGIGAGYFLIQYKGTPPNFFAAGRHSWQDDSLFVRGILDRMGQKYEIKETGGAKAAQAGLDQVLEAGAPAMGWLDMYKLPSRGFVADCLQNPLMVSLGNSYHVLNIVGSNASGSHYHLDDLSESTIEVDRESLAAARAGHKKFKNRLLTLAEPTSSTQESMAEAVTDAIGACVRGLRKQRMKNFRLEAIQKWSSSVGDFDGKDGWPKVYGSNAFPALVATHSFIKHYGTGGNFFRGMYAEFLSESAEIVKSDALHQVAQRYEDLADQWAQLADMALDTSTPLLAEARELLARYWQLSGKRQASSEPAMAEMARALLRLGESAEASFPLAGDALSQLYSQLSEHLAGLYQLEDEALRALERAVL